MVISDVCTNLQPHSPTAPFAHDRLLGSQTAALRAHVRVCTEAPVRLQVGALTLLWS